MLIKRRRWLSKIVSCKATSGSCEILTTARVIRFGGRGTFDLSHFDFPRSGYRGDSGTEGEFQFGTCCGGQTNIHINLNNNKNHSILAICFVLLYQSTAANPRHQFLGARGELLKVIHVQSYFNLIKLFCYLPCWPAFSPQMFGVANELGLYQIMKIIIQWIE